MDHQLSELQFREGMRAEYFRCCPITTRDKTRFCGDLSNFLTVYKLLSVTLPEREMNCKQKLLLE